MMAVAYDAPSGSHAQPNYSISEGSYSWTHTPVGTPKGVVVFTFEMTGDAATDKTSAVTYGGVSMSAVPGGRAASTDGNEDGACKAWFLGSGIPIGAQTVVVTRTNDTTRMGAVCCTVTALTDTEATGVVLLQQSGTLAEVNVDDGSPGTNSLRLAALYSGRDIVPGLGANTTTGGSGAYNDTGAYGYRVAYETTAGQGSRPVGFSDANTDDRAAVHLAVREVAATNTQPDTPTCTVASYYETSADLTSSAFADDDVGDTHAASQWQVDVSAGDFSDPVYDSGEDEYDLEAHTATGLTASTAYKARVRHKDDSGDAGTEWSEWSATTAAFYTQTGSAAAATESETAAADVAADHITGTVTLAAAPVAGAIVRLMRQDDDTYAADATTGIAGTYVIPGLVPGGEYHAAVEYEVGGTKYHSFSFPYLTPAKP